MSFSQRIKAVLQDFRFWVVLFFIIRLYGITNPPLEAAHSWRQTFTCMIARNFYEHGADVLFPRIDTDGERSGIIGSEFPLFNYLIFLLAKIAGYQHWYGRLINLIFSSLGVYYFYLIIKRFFNRDHAFYSGIILLCSLWFAYSRKIMPDTFSMSLTIAGLYYGLLFLYSEKVRMLCLFVILSALGGLSKLPALILLCVFVIPLFNKTVKRYIKIVLLSAICLVIGIVSLWYFYWVPVLVKNFGIQLFYQKGLVDGFAEICSHWQDALEKFYFGSFMSFVAFGVFLVGLFYAFKNRGWTILIIFFTGLLLFCFFAIRTGIVFPTHSYYIIPFIPFMAFIAGYGIAILRWTYLKVLITCAIIIESVANQQHDFRIKDSERYLLQLESTCDRVSSRTDLVAFSGGPDYKQMYFAHRRGWSLDSSRWNDQGYIEMIRKNGCKMLFINKKDWLGKLNYEIIFENENYTIYKL